MKRSTWFNKLNTNSSFIGILGKGYPNSFYKLYVQLQPNGSWYRIEYEYEADKPMCMPSFKDCHTNKHLAACRYEDSDIVRGKLTELPDYTFWDHKTGINQVFDRAVELSKYDYDTIRRQVFDFSRELPR
jgi:hypothetical protein